MLPLRSILAAGGAAIMLTLTGCGASPWEGTFSPVSPGAPALAADTPVRLRDVSWERLQAALTELEAERAASDAPPDEWPAEKKADAKARLLRALQVTADPATVQVLGRSTFRTTWQTDPNDGELAAFARRIGATTVVWSTNYLGKTRVVRDEPVSEWRTGSYPSYRDGRRHTQTFSENATIWVPVVVDADEHAFMAYFLRE